MKKKMRAGVLLTVMLMCLSDGQVTRCSVGTIIRVTKFSKASICCPAFMANSSNLFKYELLLDNSIIADIRLNKVSESANWLFTGKFEVTVDNSGVFICKTEVIYPPPLLEHCHTTEVIMEEYLPKIHDPFPVANQSCPVRFPIIPEEVMWLGCSILFVYSVSVTWITICRWRKMKRHEEDTNLYFNTRP